MSAGMCADIAVHDKSDGNPHAHIMLTMRPLNENGEWGTKSRKEYITDKNGERIKLKNGNFKTKKVDTVDWNEQSKAELWRSKWAELANKYLSENEIADRIDHRSFERQGTEQIPTIHLGVAASQMERKGITTERGNINREIKAHNKLLAQIKAKITSLKRWISEYISSAEKDTEKTDSLADLVSRADIITQNQWEKVRNLKAKSKTLLYLQNNGIDTAPFKNGFWGTSGINRGRTCSVMRVLTLVLLHQGPEAHQSTCAFLVLRKTIIHDKSHFVLTSSSTMDDRNELISCDNGRILQLFRQLTISRKYTAI